VAVGDQDWQCAESGDEVATCSECLHRHDWYDHLGPHEHMCQRYLLSDYASDPFGQRGNGG
jgi:hypothetical protein